MTQEQKQAHGDYDEIKGISKHDPRPKKRHTRRKGGSTKAGRSSKERKEK